MYTISLPTGLHRLLTRLKEAGFLAYAVGGCVRDALLGRPTNDWDVTTSATPEQIKAVFSDCRTLDTGIKHGTVTVMLDGDSYEVTVFRVDGAYTDGRHPDSVIFSSSLREDLARRDFTVNAMAYSPDEGIIDPFGGREDLQNRLLRAVGNPSARFTEDALRILRGVRFASVLGFSIEEETSRAMRDLCQRLSLVSDERVLVELTKTVLGKDAHRMLSSYHDVVSSAWHSLAEPSAYLTGVSLFPFLPPVLEVRMAALFSQVKEAASPALFLSLRFSREVAFAVSSLVLEMAKPLPQTSYEEKCLLGKYGIDFCQKLAWLWKAKCLISNETPDKISHVLTDWQNMVQNKVCLTVSDLAVKGEDLLALGVEKGKSIGDWLKTLLDRVLLDRLQNEKNALLTFVKTHL